MFVSKTLFSQIKIAEFERSFRVYRKLYVVVLHELLQIALSSSQANNHFKFVAMDMHF